MTYNLEPATLRKRLELDQKMAIIRSQLAIVCFIGFNGLYQLIHR